MEEREGKYFESLLGVFKMVAFHEIYVDDCGVRCRQQERSCVVMNVTIHVQLLRASMLSSIIG